VVIIIIIIIIASFWRCHNRENASAVAMIIQWHAVMHVMQSHSVLISDNSWCSVYSLTAELGVYFKAINIMLRWSGRNSKTVAL